MIIFICNSGKFEIVNGKEIRETWLHDVELNQLLSSVEMLFEKQHKYDTVLPLSWMNSKKLGCVLNEELYLFKDSFIDSKGHLYISLDDWNSTFSPTYGNTKVLTIRDNEIIYNYKSTNISVRIIENQTYIPLCNAVDYFSYFDMDWDPQLKKVVISEKV